MCPKGYKYFGHTSKCYKLFNPKHWPNASEACQSEGGHLASVSDSQTNEFLASLTSKYTWIGGYRLKDNENVWGWTDGSKWGYSNWASGQPENYGGRQNYVGIHYAGAGHWDDGDNKHPRHYICQIASGSM